MRKTVFKKFEWVWPALGRPYPFKFFKDCLPQILHGPFLNTLTHFILYSFLSYRYAKNTIAVQKQPPKVFCKKGVLKNFANITRKHLCQSLFFNKVAGLSLQHYQKRDSDTGFFPVNLAKILRTSFFIEHLWWLVLAFLVKMKFYDAFSE